jgi:predicted Zn-dependent protease
MGDLEGAIAAFERALKHEPDNLVLIVTLAESYTSSRRYADADRLLERGALLAADPRTFRIRQAFLSMYESGDSRPANRIFESEGEPHQWNEDLWLSWLVAIYERDYARAIAMLDGPDAGAIVPFPSYIFPKWSQLAVSHLLAGKAERALHYYELSRTQVELALTDNPADPDLLLALAETLVGIGESSEGIATARNVLHSAPAANRLRSVALRVFIPAGAHEEAIEELDAYLSEPGDWAIEGLLPDPRLDPIRHHSRFLALVEKHQRASN